MPGFFLVPFSALLYVTGAFRYSLIGYARRCVCLCCVHAPVRTLDHFSFIPFAQLIHKQVHVAIIVPLLKPITATNVRKLCVPYQTLHLWKHAHCNDHLFCRTVFFCVLASCICELVCVCVCMTGGICSIRISPRVSIFSFWGRMCNEHSTWIYALQTHVLVAVAKTVFHSSASSAHERNSVAKRAYIPS